MVSRVIKYKKTSFVATVDQEDADILLAKNWCIDFNKRSQKSDYHRVKRGATTEEKAAGSSKNITLHKEVWEKHFGKVPAGLTIDHKDFDTLNNKKSNLRLLTARENFGRGKRSTKKDNKNG